ncbi:MAG: hypothetical protein KJP06_07110, partial [Deltaproteobacteria bacterium]|nr:hypothetical protein [Deltaproteobacteria bacterium]
YQSEKHSEPHFQSDPDLKCPLFDRVVFDPACKTIAPPEKYVVLVDKCARGCATLPATPALRENSKPAATAAAATHAQQHPCLPRRVKRDLNDVFHLSAKMQRE